MGLEPNLPPVLVHDDVMGEVEAEAGAGAHGFRRKERVEDPRLHVRWDPGTVICDLHDHVVGVGAGPQLDRTAAVHRVDRVVDDIGPDYGSCERNHQLFMESPTDPAGIPEGATGALNT